MNYLSHFFIDHQEGNDYYNTGLLLPDITKGNIKTFKSNHHSFRNINHQELLLGCLKHYESDKQFHTSLFFEYYQNIINRHIKEAPFSEALQRKWFLAHILLELMIDRVIVKYAPHITDSFYNSLTAIDDTELQNFLYAFQVKDYNIFINHFNHFRSVRYIYYYTDNNKFVYSLSRIMMRAGLPEMSETDKKILETFTVTMESTYFSQPEKLIKELKLIFS